MPETFHDRKIFSLLEVASSIRKTLAERYTTVYWIKAEMNKLNYYGQSGHCYPELVERKNGKIVAQLKANLWKDDYQLIDRKFLRVLKEPLKDGIKILFSATIGFDPVYGLSLRILDIDPSYTLGDLEQEKEETIQRLRREEIFTLNKTRSLPLIPQRIAIISADTSKGYADFTKVLQTNEWGYRFFHMLFPSLLQGDKAVQSIVYQLKQIQKVAHHFDAVAIIRGGGGDVGLSCYNHYTLAREIALYPIPVLTGIGHATNETVVEMVAFQNAITPTKIAGFLIQKFHDVAQELQRSAAVITSTANRILQNDQSNLDNTTRLFRAAARGMLQNARAGLRENLQSLSRESGFQTREQFNVLNGLMSGMQRETYKLVAANRQQTRQLIQRIRTGSERTLKDRRGQIQHLQQQVSSLDPVNILKRGYSITRVDGVLLQSVQQVNDGDLITTILSDGTVSSTVRTEQTKDNNGQ